MKTIDHALKIAGWIFPDGAEIYMDTHNDADRKTCNDVQQVGKIESAVAHKAL
jgi:hypothetical protein